MRNTSWTIKTYLENNTEVSVTEGVGRTDKFHVRF
jgi:hypothetical protein